MTSATAAIVASSAESATGVPQLRTILLTDLVDSTGWVERLGDGPAAELFRAHDRLVLQLQERWRGRLIDRSDGMLLLFERPIDGLGFAIDYNRGLRELGEPHGAELTARAGLHVGEVLTWRNSDEAVRVGAKPLEIEGLAKPMAARLMTMARPGQILLSAVAEPLAHRAARELGERGQHLLWKSHGRWRFKGVPQPQQIFEVGEPGIAPLRAPPSSPKAWRDIPLWRRPAALAAEAAVVAVIAVGLWFFMRPQPAIAFNERDWVVLADLRNLTGEPLLDDSLEQAFRISLEQSRHVNVLSDLKTRDTLARMQREPDTELDRTVASEIAIRDGARAVILPTVAEVGGRVRVSAEVIDPHSQTTVHAEMFDGKGAGSALDSIDKVTAALRTTLGEALQAVEQDSEPLPKVTTEDLEALRSYALGEAAFAQGEWRDALALYARAIELDAGFALAHLASARVYVALSDRPAAVPYLTRALQLREGLTPRDRLYLEAWEAELLRPALALERWKVLASVYPDNHAGAQNAAMHLFFLNDFQGAEEQAAAANVAQAPLRAHTLDLIGRSQMAQGHLDKAQANFEAANASIPGVSARRVAALLAVRGDLKAANAMASDAGTTGYKTNDVVRYIDLISFAVDEGRLDLAQSYVSSALAELEQPTFIGRQFSLIGASISLIEDPAGFSVSSCRAIAEEALTALAQSDSSKALGNAYVALFAAYLAQRAGDRALAEDVLVALEPYAATYSNSVVEKMRVVVRAGNARLSGSPEDAVDLLSPTLDGTELFQARVAMHDAMLAMGQPRQAIVHAEWLTLQRGLAYIESNGSQVAQSLNVMDTRLAHLFAAEALMEAEEPEAARGQLETFLSIWPRERLPLYLARRVDVILPASKQKTT